MNSKAWVLGAALLAGGFAQATCYTVYRADGSFLQEGSTTPVDLTQPLGDTVPAKFGDGATMTVSDLGFFCKDRRGEQLLPKQEAAVKKQVAAAAAKKEAAAAKDAAAAKEDTAAAKEDAAAAKEDTAAVKEDAAAAKDAAAAPKEDAASAPGEEAKKADEPAAKQVAEQASH